MVRTSSRLRLLIPSLLVVAALGSSVTGGLYFRRQLSDLGRTYRSFYIGKIQDLLDLGLSWDSISPSILSGIHFYEPDIADRQSGATIHARELLIDVSLRAFLHRDMANSIPSAHLIAPVIDLNGREDVDGIIELVEYMRSFKLASPNTLFEFDDGMISISLDGSRTEISQLNGTVSLDEEEVYVSSRTSVTFSQNSAPLSFQSRISVDATMNRITSDLGATVEIGEVTGSLGTLNRQVWRITHTDYLWNARKIEDDLPLDLQAEWDERDDFISATIQSERLRISDLFTPGESIPQEIRVLLNQSVTTDSWVRFSIRDLYIDEAAGWLESTVPSIGPVPSEIPIETQFRLVGTSLSIPYGRAYGTTGYVDFHGNTDLSLSTFSTSIDLFNFSYAGTPVLNGELSLVGTGGIIGASSNRIRVGSSYLYSLSGEWDSGYYSNGRLEFKLTEEDPFPVLTHLRFQDRDNYQVSINSGRIPLVSVLALLSDLEIPLPKISLNDLPIRGTTLEMAVVLDLREGEMVADVGRFVLANPSKLDLFLFAQGSYEGETVTLDHFYTRFREYSASGQAVVQFEESGSVFVETSFEIEDIAYSLKALYNPGSVLVIDGDYGVNVQVRWGRDDLIQVTGGFENTPIPGTRAVAGGSFTGRYVDMENWFLELEDTTLEGLIEPSLPRKIAVTFYAAVSPTDVKIAVSEVTDGLSTLTGTADIEYDLIPAFFARSTLRFLSIDGSERYVIDGSYSPGLITADMQYAGFPLKRINPKFTRGRVDGTASYRAEGDDYRALIALSTRNAILGEQDVSARLEALLEPRRLTATDVLIGFGPQLISVETLDVDGSSGIIAADGIFRRPEYEVEIPFSLSGTFPALDRLTPREAITLPLSVELVLRDEEETRYSIERVERTTHLEKGDGSQIVSLEDKGSFTAQLEQPGAVQAQIQGSLSAGAVEATVRDIRIDLSQIPVFNRPGQPETITILSGTATGGLRVLGNLSDPDLFGTLQLRDVDLKTPFSPDSAGPFNTSFLVEEKIGRLQQTTTAVGAASVSLSGDFLLNRFQIEHFRVGFSTETDEGIHIDHRFGTVDTDGYARGTMTFEGSSTEMAVTGDITVYRAQFALEENEETDQTSGIPFKMDLAMVSGRAVQFIWPNTDFPVLRSNFATEQEVRLVYDSNEDFFTFTGDVDIQSGDIFYFDRNFLIRNGEIKFQENQDRFDPRLSVRAEIREVAATGPVRIYLVADENRLSEFSPRFESDPLLSHTDIVAILGGNILEQSGESSISLSTALLSTSDIVTQFGIFKQFEETVRRSLDLDLFAVRTNFLQNVVLTAINPLEQDATPINPSIGYYLHNTSIFMGRYLGSSVFAQLLLQMRSRDFSSYEDQTYTGVRNLGGVLIDSEISLEWQTPFFLLEWTLTPQYPEELFIRDNTFTFSWRFSY